MSERRTKAIRPVASICLAILLLAALAGAQAVPAVQNPASGGSSAAVHHEPGAAASERQKALLADSERMLALANQLKAAVDKIRRDELSMQVIREADEIERLAKAAKSRIP